MILDMEGSWPQPRAAGLGRGPDSCSSAWYPGEQKSATSHLQNPSWAVSIARVLFRPRSSLGPQSARWGINLSSPLVAEQMYSPQSLWYLPNQLSLFTWRMFRLWELGVSWSYWGPPSPCASQCFSLKSEMSAFFPETAALLTSNMLHSELIKAEESKGEAASV